MKHSLTKYFLAALFLTVTTPAFADITIPIYFTSEQGVGQAAGSVVVTQTKYGLLFTPNLHGLKPGIHGFHIHLNSSCNNNGEAAGGHLDPQHTDKHLGPYNDKGHLGDLPALFVDADGTSTIPVLAPRLKALAKIKNHSLMIHEGGDNYSDTPKAGGGGGRMLCGVIE